MRLFYLLCLAILLPCTGVRAQKEEAKTPDIATKTAKLQKMPGYFDAYWSDDEGKIYLEINRWDEDFLYVNSLAAGLGSNDIGLDRNQLGGTRVVQFHRVGPKVLLKERNLDYRAVSDNPDEVASVRDAFAQSTIHGFKVAAKTGDRVLIDLTPLLMTDAHGVAARLKRNKQGTYKIDADRSAVYLEKTKNFPLNSEFEASLTFVGEATGSQLRSVTPTSGSFTLRLHHSFVQLPDDKYEPRKFDPRSGYNSRSFADYATPIDQPLVKRVIPRHRLEKKDPAAAMSEPVEPIIYYLDRGAPEPIRSALLEGASWWNQAFEAAGYKNAFQVKVLPEGADPLDVRYNVINWVHRSTRGWSYGSSVTDPRTGEIIKGHVLLGSLRVRQDFLLAQGLIKAYGKDGTTPDPRLEQMALARLRQLSAHEVGHTIGLAHNFAASTNDRSSVMDYPHPYITLKDGKVDFSEAYAVGIGVWDKQTIKYGYSDFPKGTDEAGELTKILNENKRLGLKYISDSDARPVGSMQPDAHLWENGADPIVEMDRLMELRAHALNNFGLDNIPDGMPLSELEKVLVPVYLMHRYQVEALAKQVGGYHYTYAVKGGKADEVKPVDYKRQQAAIDLLIRSVAPDALALPDELLGLIPPSAMGYSRDRESFNTHNGGAFDPLAMAETAADNNLKFLLHHHRLARIGEQHALFSGTENMFPSLAGYLKNIGDQLSENLDGAQREYQRQIAQIVEKRYVAHLLQAAANEGASEQVRAAALGQLTNFVSVKSPPALGDPNASHVMYLYQEISRFFRDPGSVEVIPAPELPDGSPIGCGGLH